MKQFLKTKRKPVFSAGQLVKIKSRESIIKMNGPAAQMDGCSFMDQMYDYCGRTYLVSKVVTSFFNEHQRRSNRPHAPLYILGDLRCNGNTDSFEYTCDHSCFILWHEDWLEEAGTGEETDDMPIDLYRRTGKTAAGREQRAAGICKKVSVV